MTVVICFLRLDSAGFSSEPIFIEPRQKRTPVDTHTHEKVSCVRFDSRQFGMVVSASQLPSLKHCTKYPPEHIFDVSILVRPASTKSSAATNPRPAVPGGVPSTDANQLQHQTTPSEEGKTSAATRPPEPITSPTASSAPGATKKSSILPVELLSIPSLFVPTNVTSDWSPEQFVWQELYTFRIDPAQVRPFAVKFVEEERGRSRAMSQQRKAQRRLDRAIAAGLVPAGTTLSSVSGGKHRGNSKATATIPIAVVPVAATDSLPISMSAEVVTAHEAAVGAESGPSVLPPAESPNVSPSLSNKRKRHSRTEGQPRRGNRTQRGPSGTSHPPGPGYQALPQQSEDIGSSAAAHETTAAAAAATTAVAGKDGMEMVPLSLHKHHPQQGTSRQVMPISGVPPTMSIFSYPAKLFPVLPLLLQYQKVDVSETVYTVMDVYGQRHRMATLPLVKDIQVQEENRWIEPAVPPPVVVTPPTEKKAPAKRHSKSEASSSSRGHHHHHHSANSGSSSGKKATTSSGGASGSKGRRFSKLRAAFDDFNSDEDSSSSDSDIDENEVDDGQRPVRTKANEKRTTRRPSRSGAVIPPTEPSETNLVEDLETEEAETQTTKIEASTITAATVAAATTTLNAKPQSSKDGTEPLRSRKKSKRLRMSKSSVATSDSSLMSWSSSSDSSSDSSRGERDREHDQDHDSDMDKAADKEDISPESRKAAASENKDDEEQQCIVCLSDTREVILFPCRHLNTCLPCAKMLIASRNQCPICRSTAEAIIHIVAFHEASSDDKA